MSKFIDDVTEAMARANDEIEHKYILSRKLNEQNAFTKTKRFSWGDRAFWPIQNGFIGTYLYYLDNLMVYVGQGVMVGRLVQSLNAFLSYKIDYGSKIVPWKKSNEKWIVTPKIYNKCRNINRWSIRCIIFHTGSKKMDKEYAKKTEDRYIINYDLPKYGLNKKVGDNT